MSNLPKYKLIQHSSGMRRIQALRDFSDVKAGDVGGFVTDGNNLSQDGDSWIYDEAMVLGDARVLENATVRGNSVVKDNSAIDGQASVSGCVTVTGGSLVTDSARVSEAAFLIGAEVRHFATVDEFAYIGKGSKVLNSAVVAGNARLSYSAIVLENAYIKTTSISGPVRIGSDAYIVTPRDYLAIELPSGKVAAYRKTDGTIAIQVGCKVFPATRPASRLEALAAENCWIASEIALVEPTLNYIRSYFGVKDFDV